MKNTYDIFTDNEQFLGEVTNEKQAKQIAKEKAIEYKTSIYIIKNELFYARAEFPYYLRGLTLDTSDIKYYKLDF